MPEHVSEAQIQSLIDGTLSPMGRETVERHLDECDACLQRLAAWGDRVAEELAIGGPVGDAAGDMPAEVLEPLRRAAEGGAMPPGETARVTTELVLVKTEGNQDKRIGEGGNGAVFEYTDTRFGRPVAIKVLKAGRAAAPFQAARFRREMELTASIDHPGCPIVYGSGTTADGRDFYWMQRIAGLTLDRMAAAFHADGGRRLRRSDLRCRELLELFRQVCQTISAAHEREIIHRDLKPANVCVHHDGRPVVLDWGLAKRCDAAEPADGGAADDPLQADATHDGTVLGTLLYMAPEQARGELAAITERTDVFGLGAILHELLTGRAPHAELAERLTDKRELLHAIGRGAGGDLAGVPRELASICHRALAAEPAARYASPSELANDVGQWLAGFEVSAHRYSLPERVGMAVRRRPLTFLFGACASLLLVTAIAAAGLFANQAEAQRRIAEQRFESALAARLEMVQEVQDELAREGNTGFAREKLLNRAIDGIQRLIADAQDQAGAELTVIQARLELAHLERRERKNWKPAREMYAAIAADLRAGGLSEGNALQFRKLLADADKGVAECTRDIDGVAAAKPLFDAWHRDALRFLEEFPRQPVAALSVSQSHVWQGRLANDRGPDAWPAAQRHFQAAMDILARTTPPADKQDQYLYERLIVMSEWAQLLDDQDKTDEAIAFQRQIVEEMTGLAQRQPTRRNRLGLIQDHMQLGVFYKYRGDHEVARTALSQALDLANQLAAEFQSDRGIRHLQWLVQLNLATTHRSLGQPQRALELLADLARRNDAVDLSQEAVDALDDQATANGAMARAYEDANDPAAASDRYRVAAQFRAEILRRDAANQYNLQELLVAARKSCMLAAAAERGPPIVAAVEAICQQVETLEPEKNLTQELRNELAGVYYFLAAAQQATAKAQDDAAAELIGARQAVASYERADDLVKSLADPNPELLAMIQERLNEGRERIRELAAGQGER